MLILQTRLYSQEINSKQFHESLILHTSYTNIQKFKALHVSYFSPNQVTTYCMIYALLFNYITFYQVLI